jgi:hypothetical protein
MRSESLQWTVLRAASLLAPSNQRGEWLEWWRSELWYVTRRGALLFCLGAFQDALWLRRNNLRPVRRTGVHPETPLSCLGFLASIATASLFTAIYLSGPLKTRSVYWHLSARDLPMGCIAMLMLSCLLLPTLAVGQAPTNGQTRWPTGLCQWIFLALKIALVQPILLCGFLIWILIAPRAPFAVFGLFAGWILVLRWVFTDQRRRCPVCLRLLTDPVRMGTPSQTFLEWYGVESMCSRGHGLLHISENSASYSGKQQWINLDSSWRGLFSKVTGLRQ